MALQIVSPSVEQGLTVKTPRAQTVQLIIPFPGQMTPGGQGKVQLVIDPERDQLLGGQKRWDENVGQ